MKKKLLLFVLVFNIFFSIAQEAERKYHLYIKLAQPINLKSKKIANLENRFKVSFHHENKISKIIENDVYKIGQNISKTQLPQLLKYVMQLDDFLYYDFIPATPVQPPHDIPPVTPNFVTNQTYLEPDPGVNAFYAWSVGATGTGINIRVLEYGINTNHEEFNHKNIAIALGYTIHPDVSENYQEHGTATAGVIFSDYGSYGTSGIAYNANEYILYPEFTEEYNYDRVQALTNAINNSSEGDVVVYEMQNENLAPAEVNPLVWDLTKVATDKGVVVVAAAGNGSQDLDSAGYVDYMNLGDSGAIIVGASQMGFRQNHNASSISTFGSRVDVQAWGSGVYTTGTFSITAIKINDDFNQAYMSGFTNTSAATAVVGGCVAALQSYYFGLTGSYLTSVEMRDLLINTGIPQGTGGHIGPALDLEAAINAIDQTLSAKGGTHQRFITYPNPVIDDLQIKQVHNSHYSLSIYNALGAKVFFRSINQKHHKVDLSFLQTGFYMLKISNTEGYKISKIFKK